VIFDRVDFPKEMPSNEIMPVDYRGTIHYWEKKPRSRKTCVLCDVLREEEPTTL